MHPVVARGVVLAAPTLLAASIVLSAFNETGGGPSSLLRPLVIAAVGAMLLTVAGWLLTRRADLTAISASGAVLLLMGGLPLLMAILAVLVAAAVAQWFRIHRRRMPRPSVATLATLVLAIFVTSVVWLSLSGGVAWADFRAPSASGATPGRGEPTMPNLYVVILDSYPRQDTLSDTFGHDDTSFLDGLRTLGFDVYPEASSATVETPLTVLSMLSGSTHDLPRNWAAAAREARRRLAEAPGLEALADHGYERVVINSSAVHVEMAGWDVTYQPGQLNNLEATLVARSPFAPLLTGWVLDQQRERFDRTLEILASLADPDRQRAVLAHIGPPHPPLLFGPDGEPADPAGCWPRCDLFDTSPERLGMDRAEFAAAFVDQIEVVNRRVTDVVRHLVRTDPDAVIVVMSDHGTRASLADREEWNRTLLVSRTPGHDRLLATDPSPRDLFGRLLAAYRP